MSAPVRSAELGMVHGPVPPPVSVFGKHWPGPLLPPSRRLLGVAAATGVGAAVAIPDGRDGVGWLVTGLLLVGAVLAIGWRPLRPPGELLPHRVAVVETAWMPVAVALSGVAAVRDAGWLVGFCMLAACAAGSLAVAGRSFRSVVRGAVAVPLGALRSPLWVGRGLRAMRRTTGGLRLVASLLVGLGLLAVFGPLLASADPAFGEVLAGLVPTLDGGAVPGWVVRFGLGAAGVVGAGFLLAAPPTAPPPPERVSRLRTVEWGLPVGLLAGLFALYVATTLPSLFGLDAHVRDTSGLTYAEYARSGFWQLLAVTVLSLLVIVLGSRWASPAAPLWTRGLLGALAGLTLVIVASALTRIWLYQQVYGFTLLRLLVLTCELWLGAGFVMMLVSVLRLRPVRYARGMLAAGIGALLALAVLDPERFVAEHNVDRYAATGRIDVEYLSGLSADAVPALQRLPEPLRSCALAPIAARLGPVEEGGWRSTNLSRAGARADLAAATIGTCRMASSGSSRATDD
ncbi:MAG: DUF4173 domain-containing protein [Pseudonocardia sp.]|uniref:DUF4153 domain-containing protein n=1 Tax=Pseudonocardia sp. TaxID=60912 RepID=UPI001ACBCBFF|nr:DUF4173 domain-containing protein [Pseudonocardia sp.]MBN9099206.1 DUF4173 domain-containing protein [Pseudonocardia sp.]